jgi:uncharacterized protein
MDKEQLRQILSKQADLSAKSLQRPLALRDLDLSKELTTQEISIITGVRRCGKSLYLAQLKNQFAGKFASLLVEFDDPALADFEGADFNRLVEIVSESFPNSTLKKLLLLDEIQNIPRWEKWLIQIAKDPNIKIVVTGSNAKLLSSELGTLLTGRHQQHELSPLSFKEILRFDHPQVLSTALTQEQLLATYENYYTYGGFPRSYVERDPAVLPQYFTDIVERDVIVRHGSRLKTSLKELSRVLCSDNTRLLNRSRLAKKLGVKDDSTIKRYCHWLEECYLFHEVKGFSPSVRKQMRSNPKYYCVDPALARYSAFSVLGDQGSFLENMVYLELRRRGYELHYWRSTDGSAEVDFIGRRAGEKPIAVQVSLTVVDEATLYREISALTSLQKELGITEHLLITKADHAQVRKFDDTTIAIVPFLLFA